MCISHQNYTWRKFAVSSYTGVTLLVTGTYGISVCSVEEGVTTIVLPTGYDFPPFSIIFTRKRLPPELTLIMVPSC